MNRNNRSARRRMLVAATAMVLVLVIAAIALVQSPPGQRFLARPAEAAPVAGQTKVIIQSDPRLNHVYAPSAIQVEVGTTVTWHFADVDEDGVPVAHNVVFDGVRSEVLATGTFSHTFTAPGSYAYVCTLHPFMSGRVDVVESLTQVNP